MSDIALSRPIRAATQFCGADEATLESLFTTSRVLVRIENAFVEDPDAQETFACAVNQLLRFCPNIAIDVPRNASHLVRQAVELAAAIHGERHCITQLADPRGVEFQAILNIGTDILDHSQAVTINSGGWIARVAPTATGTRLTYARPDEPNPIGAMAAACAGVGHVFLLLLGKRSPRRSFEFSLFSHEQGPPGTLAMGPPLPREPLFLDAFVVGCGGVMNGWMYAVKRLPIAGQLQAIDRQTLRVENIGPYVASTRGYIGKPKAEMIRDYLAPKIVVTPRPEEWELFKIRFRYGLTMPPLVINGLDNVETRHSVQREWPETLIDMAAGGLTAQVIVKRRTNSGLCLLNALQRPQAEEDYVDRLARETGLRPERIRTGATTPISAEDVEAAPADKRPGLDAARQRGELVCGRVTGQNLFLEHDDPNFAPAVPFVTGFAGLAGASETMKWLMGHRHDSTLHYQCSAQSWRARALAMRCEPNCECQTDGLRQPAALPH